MAAVAEASAAADKIDNEVNAEESEDEEEEEEDAWFESGAAALGTAQSVASALVSDSEPLVISGVLRAFLRREPVTGGVAVRAEVDDPGVADSNVVCAVTGTDEATDDDDDKPPTTPGLVDRDERPPDMVGMGGGEDSMSNAFEVLLCIGDTEVVAVGIGNAGETPVFEADAELRAALLAGGVLEVALVALPALAGDMCGEDMIFVVMRGAAVRAAVVALVAAAETD